MSRILALLPFLLILAAAPVNADPVPEPHLLISVDELAGILHDEDVLVLHVAREKAHFKEGHLPGAVFLPLGSIAQNRDGRLNVMPPRGEVIAALEAVGVRPDLRVVVYGNLDGLAASRAFLTLDVLGHPRVAVLDGGLEAWQAAGHTVSVGAPAHVSPGALEAQLDDSAFVSASWIADHLDDERVLLIDARPEDQFTGEEPGDDIERPGHIPGAVNLFWQSSLGEDGTFLPLEELQARWSAAGVSEDVLIVTYCRTGMQASHAYLTARLLGYRPHIYDPSFAEWSNLTEYPVAFTAN